MLNKDVLMQDIDIDQWRNAQDLLLESAKEKRRIIVLHDDGVVQKCEHTAGIPVVGTISRVTSPAEQAKKLYESNAETVDFVAIFERRAFDEYFTRIQNSWVIDEELDSYIHRTYELLDEYADRLITYPGPAKKTLGLQYRFGIGWNDAVTALHRWVDPESSLLLGVYDDGQLWASLVLDFDATMEVVELTTVNAEKVDVYGEFDEVAERVSQWLSEYHRAQAATLLWKRSAFERLRAAEHKEEALAQALDRREAVFIRKG